MKRTLLVLGMVLALAMTAMASASVAESDADSCVNLLAGQTEPVGEVCISDDGETLEVTYTTDAPWQLSETHLAVSTDEPSTGEWTQNGWQNRPGNPVPGQFPYSETHYPLVNEYTYTIPFNEIGATSDVELYVAAHAVVRKSSKLAPELAWQRSSENAVAAFPGYGGQWDPASEGFEIPLDPEQVVWDNGLYFNNNVPLGREFASWNYAYNSGGSYAGYSDLRRFQASFEVPEGYEVTAGRLKTTDFDAGIPINDNVYLFANGPDNLLFWGGTRVNQIAGEFQGMAGVQALRGTTEPVETDRWYIPGSFPDVTDFVEGQNAIDVFTEENEKWGGLGKLILDLDVFRYETAWGYGDRFVERGNWATFFTYQTNLVVSGKLDSAAVAGITVSIPEGNYLLTVSGTWQNGPHWLVDAVCVEQGSDGARNGSLAEADRVWLRTWDSGAYLDPPFGDVLVDGDSPWSAYTDADCPDANHTYSTSVTVYDGSIDLKVYDNYHGDNDGLLDFTFIG